MKFLVTGGAGFIGSEVVKQLIGMDEEVINVDKLTYASCIKSLEEISSSQNYKFYKEDICSFEKMSEIIFSEEPDAIMHLAAESHVDNSITDPDVFIKTNIFGTYNLLNASKKFFNETRPDKFFTMYLPMKFMAILILLILLLRRLILIYQVLLTQHLKLAQII